MSAPTDPTVVPDDAPGTGRRREKHILHAARDPAADLARSGGADGPEVRHSRAEIARLRG